eukprot:355550-Chlamydomonas_euryale.AAC.7
MSGQPRRDFHAFRGSGAMSGKSPSKLDADGQARAAACAFLEVQRAEGHMQVASNSQAIAG